MQQSDDKHAFRVRDPATSPTETASPQVQRIQNEIPETLARHESEPDTQESVLARPLQWVHRILEAPRGKELISRLSKAFDERGKKPPS